MHRVEVASRAQRELRRIVESDRRRIYVALEKLAHDPRPKGAIKLKGPLYRLRFGPYRVIYSISHREQLIVVLKVARREKDTYDHIEDLL